MTTPTEIVPPGHILQGLSKLLSPFKGRPRIASWIAVPIQQVQELETQLWSLVSLLDVDVADEVRLVLLAKIVGQQPRGTLEQLRRYTKCRILVNRSAGTAPQLIRIASLLTGGPGSAPPGEITYTEYQPATVVIEAVDGVVELDAEATIEFLRAAKLAGVRLLLVASSHDDGLLTGTVAGAIASRTTPDPTHGFSTALLSDGGYTAQSR